MTDPDIKIWFGRQVEDCMDSLYGFSLRLTRNGADAEDLAAESITKAWSAVESLKDRRLFRPWLFRIAHNCYVSGYRKKAVRPVEISYDTFEDDEKADNFADFLLGQTDEFLLWWGSPEREFANKVLKRDILTAIERLPETFRTVILLVTVEGLSYGEAAEVLDVPTGTVHSRMKRGRTLLQKALWEHAIEAGLVLDQKTEECAI